MATPAPKAMTTDPNDSLAKVLAWLYQLGAVGIAIGGLIGAAIAKYHEYFSSKRFRSKVRRAMEEIANEDAYNQLIAEERNRRHERE